MNTREQKWQKHPPPPPPLKISKYAKKAKNLRGFGPKGSIKPDTLQNICHWSTPFQLSSPSDREIRAEFYSNVQFFFFNCLKFQIFETEKENTAPYLSLMCLGVLFQKDLELPQFPTLPFPFCAFQAITFLGRLTFELKIAGPSLVVVSLSGLAFWTKELKTRCPSLRVMQLHSTEVSSRQALKEVSCTLHKDNFAFEITHQSLMIMHTCFLAPHHAPSSTTLTGLQKGFRSINSEPQLTTPMLCWCYPLWFWESCVGGTSARFMNSQTMMLDPTRVRLFGRRNIWFLEHNMFSKRFEMSVSPEASLRHILALLAPSQVARNT